MKINTSLFRAFLTCPTRCFLHSIGKRGTGNSYANWVRTREAAYLRQAIDRLRQQTPHSEFCIAPSGEHLRSAKWTLAVRLRIQTKTTESEVQAVERVPSGQPGKPSRFLPIRSFAENKLPRNAWLLLAFDALCLSEALGREIDSGILIHGSGYALRKVSLRSQLQRTRRLVAGMSALVAKGSPPDLVLNRHCGECEYRDTCRSKAIEKDDLSLLPTLSGPERMKCCSKGIFTVTQLSYTFRPRRRPKRLRDKREKYHHALKALAIREKKIYVVGKPELKLQGTPVYLDVEGIPDRDFYYLVGVRIGTGDTAIQHSLWADDSSQEKTIWAGFLDLVGTVEHPVLVHYGSYESTFFKRMSERYGGPQENSPTATAISSSVNLLSFIFAQVYFPTFSNGLKEIAGHLGLRWTEPDASGLQAIEWRERWEQSRDNGYKQKLVFYNAQDCEALAVVTGAVLRFLRRESQDHKPEGVADRQIVRTDELRPPEASKWRDFISPVKELEEITKCAHWDYQRERVYFRSSRVLKKLRKEKPRRLSRTIDKVYPPSRVCPACGRKGTAKGAVRSRSVQALIFGRFSVKRRFLRYEYQAHWCRACKRLFGADEPLLQRGKRRKWDRSVAAYVLYHTIELGIPAMVVAESLRTLFGLSLDSATLVWFKRDMASYYASTREQIMSRIVAGHLVHADETYVSVQAKRGWVWAFTNMDEVVYVYSATREADVPQSVLKGFKGVLVSDFLAAYDTIPCAQQKCLIHLARDLNGEILDNPFDEDLKLIVKTFGVLARAIVADIERHGLKRHFLHKYTAEVRRFYRRVIDVNDSSPAATACVERFRKNRDKLFTFLDHDGVPWNNNNAEHAMKAVARGREVLGSSPTESSMRDYLVLLSICQTCKYQGLDFLDFLRSGEKDIHAFAEKRTRRGAPRPSHQPKSRVIPEGAGSDLSPLG